MRRALLIAALAVFLVGGCATNGDEVELEAVFDDAVELAPRHKVMTAGVRIGQVTSIELTDDLRAHVKFRIEGDTGLPSEVMAELKKTQVLGEYYVNLIPLNEEGELTSGVIARTRTAGEIEELVESGTEFLSYVAADQLSAAIHAGAMTFGGRGGTLGSVLTNMEVFFTRFGAREDDILRLLDGLDELLAGITPEAETHAAALEALARSSVALEQEDERLLDALEDLQRLAVVGERIMREHRVEIDNFWRRIELILAEVTRIDGALEDFLFWWPMHNLHVPPGIFNEHAQIWADVIICDTDTEERDNVTMTCDPPNPGGTSTPPPDYGLDDCDLRHENCGWPEGTDRRAVRDGGPPEHRSDPRFYDNPPEEQQ